MEASQDLLDPTHEVENIQLVAAILLLVFIESSAVQSGWQEIKEQNTDKQPLIAF